MAKTTQIIVTSDRSGEVLTGDDQALLSIEGRHCDVSDTESRSLTGLTDPVTVSILHGNGDQAQVVLERSDLATWFGKSLSEFNAWLAQQPIGGATEAPAPSPRRRSRSRTDEVERVNYATAEHAGVPHRGRVASDEAEYVRKHLKAVNKRLAAEGHRTIEPGTELGARYGV
jgi:hypothetical protein